MCSLTDIIVMQYLISPANGGGGATVQHSEHKGFKSMYIDQTDWLTGLF